MTVDAEEDYARAGLAGSLAPGSSPALIIVDPARVYTEPSCPLYAGAEAACEVMRALLHEARAAGVPTLITRVEHDPSGRTGGLFARKVPATRWFGADSPYAGYIDGLAPAGGDIEIVKQYPSAFAGTSLGATLTALRVDTLLITGLTTSGCIRATATDAMQSGFVPIVVRDAVADRLEGPHEANLFDIQAKIGEVVSADRAGQLLRRRR
ncbi:isochorismatase family protein [Dactylosporangium sp. NPDC050688]|uniref:isochorismatase family protein n=1 Tax=Dactylosporangium sp. NPDC050688 TaxID=3157217 RepID=UPI0033DE5941